MSNKSNMQALEGNWDEIKGEVKSRWRKLTHEQVNSIKGKYEKLVALLKKNYGYNDDEIDEKIAEFIDKLDIEEAVSAFQNAKEKLANSVDTVKEKSQVVQENVVDYIKENPVKTVGFSLLAGMLASILLIKK